MQYLFLAFLQGLTEFLPVSSSGHLVFFQKMFGFEDPLLSFDIILHLATALSVIVFLRKDIAIIISECISAMKDILSGKKWTEVWGKYDNFRLGVLVFTAILPAIIVGLLLNSAIETMFASLRVVGCTFLITGAILFSTKFIKKKKDNGVRIGDAVSIGIAQAIAIIPGISRSGMTISCGIFRGLDKNLAARFSFILAVPTIIAAAIYKLKGGIGDINIGGTTLLVSFVVAFLSGYGALAILSKMVARAKFHYFSYYCFAMGILSIILSVYDL